MRLKDKVAFISGGRGGWARRRGAFLPRRAQRLSSATCGRELGREVAREICEAGGEAIFIHLDVASEESWQKAIAATVERFGKLDILVNNAGITASGGVLETTVETWDRIMDVNAKGVFLGTKVAIPEMRKAGGGSIVNISSQMGLVGSDMGSPAYNASKGAVHIFTKSAALRHVKEGYGSIRSIQGPSTRPC